MDKKTESSLTATSRKSRNSLQKWRWDGPGWAKRAQRSSSTKWPRCRIVGTWNRTSRSTKRRPSGSLVQSQVNLTFLCWVDEKGLGILAMLLARPQQQCYCQTANNISYRIERAKEANGNFPLLPLRGHFFCKTTASRTLHKFSGCWRCWFY